MRIEGTFLRSKLSRRIFLMFCVAVAIPAAAVFLLTYRTAAANATRAAQSALRTENKHFAFSVLERLQAAYAMLERLDAISESGGIDQPLLDPFFSELAIVTSSLPVRDDGALAAAMSHVPAQELRHRNLLVLALRNGKPPRIVLLSHRAGASGGVIVAGTLRPSFLWGHQEEIAIDGRICVDAAVRLTCVGELPPQRDAALMHDDWELFLKSPFAAESWKFSATREAAPLLASYLNVLAPVAAGLLFLVLMLSSVQIRRILVPLETLLSRIRAVSRDTHAYQEPETADELGALNRTFSEMERRIHAQMQTLRTLAEIDRLILDRVSVTAVIAIVIARIHALIDVAAIGITTRGPNRRLKHFIGFHGQPMLNGDLPSMAPLCEEAYEHTGASRWSGASVPGPGLAGRDIQRIEHLTLSHGDGAGVWIVLALSPASGLDDTIRAEIQELAERIAVAVAVEAHESLLVYQARHDPLTELPNRLAAVEALRAAIARVKGTQREFSTVFIDLDRFKSINDGLGHTLGDLILSRTSERIKQSIGNGNFVSRFGGDEFFVILHDSRSIAEATAACARIAAAFSMPIVANGLDLLVKFSAGVALYPQHGSDAEELIHNADVAMYRAKKVGGNRIEFFAEEMNTAALTHVQLEADLRQAIQQRTLGLEYQPRIDSRNGRIVGAEALVRWTHPVKGNISPVVFVPLAEECGLIEELGGFVIAEACRHMGEWKRLGLAPPVISINISTHQLRSGNLMRSISDAVTSNAINWEELEIEVTESVFINDSGAATQQLQAIRDAGATVAIDDFGIGYSSLAYLTRLPTDTLKIDRAFVAAMNDDEASEAVVRSIVALAKALGKRIVAEGVESMQQVDMLAAMGCHTIQGYVYYRSLSAKDLQDLIASSGGQWPDEARMNERPHAESSIS